MHQQLAVGVGDGVGQLQEQRQPRFQRLGGAGLVDGDAVDILQHEVGQPAVADAGVQQRGDVRVRQARQGLAFLGEAVQHGLRVHAAAQQLDGGAAVVAAVGAAGLEDLAHAAAADEADDGPGPQPLAVLRGVAGRRGRSPGRVGGAAEEIVRGAPGGVVVVGQQAAQLGHGGFVQPGLDGVLDERIPFGRAHRRSGFEGGPDGGPAWGGRTGVGWRVGVRHTPAYAGSGARKAQASVTLVADRPCGWALARMDNQPPR